MSVDTRIRLSPDVHIDDVAEVIGILAGLKPEKVPFKDGTGFYARVPGVECQNTCVVGMAHIVLTAPKGKTLIDGEPYHFCSYHFEPSNSGRKSDHFKLLFPRSTPFWIAMGRRLADFFGGTIDYSDCDSKSIDYRRGYPKLRNSPEDGRPYFQFQEKILAVKPLTRADLQAARKWACYSDVGFENES